jgi:hypothetical protein
VKTKPASCAPTRYSDSTTRRSSSFARGSIKNAAERSTIPPFCQYLLRAISETSQFCCTARKYGESQSPRLSKMQLQTLIPPGGRYAPQCAALAFATSSKQTGDLVGACVALISELASTHLRMQLINCSTRMRAALFLPPSAPLTAAHFKYLNWGAPAREPVADCIAAAGEQGWG